MPLCKPCRIDHSIGRFTRLAEAGLVIVLAVWLAALAGDQEWPYRVRDRRIVSKVVSHDDELAMQRLIQYDREDCWRQYDRRVVSLTKEGPRAGMVFRPAPVIEQRLPLDLSDVWQTWSTKLPADFPCGPARLVETVTAGCSLWQRYIRHLHKPDIQTNFTVTGCDKPPPG